MFTSPPSSIILQQQQQSTTIHRRLGISNHSRRPIVSFAVSTWIMFLTQFIRVMCCRLSAESRALFVGLSALQLAMSVTWMKAVRRFSFNAIRLPPWRRWPTADPDETVEKQSAMASQGCNRADSRLSHVLLAVAPMADCWILCDSWKTNCEGIPRMSYPPVRTTVRAEPVPKLVGIQVFRSCRFWLAIISRLMKIPWCICK